MGFSSNNTSFNRPFLAQANSRTNANRFQANNADISQQSGEVVDPSSLQQTSLQPFNFLQGSVQNTATSVPVQSSQTPGVMDVVYLMLQMLQLVLQLNGAGDDSTSTLPDKITTPGSLPAWQPSPQFQEMDLSNPVDLKGRQAELMGGLSKEFDTLITAVDQSAPGSDARATAETTLATRWTGLQGDPKTLQEFSILQGLKDQHVVITDLIAQGKKSSDPAYRAANVTKKGLYDQLGALNATGQANLPTVDFASSTSIQTRQQELLGALDPQLNQMITQLNTLNPESPLAGSLSDDIATRAYQLDNSAATATKVQEFMSLQELKQLNSVGATLGSIVQAYPANSATYQQIQQRMTAISQQRDFTIGNISTLQGYSGQTTV